MLQRMQDALSALSGSITNPTVASNLLAEVQAALATLDTNAAASLANMNNFIALVDGNPSAFDNATRNVSGELAGRALSARYMLAKVPSLPSGTITEFPVLTAGSQLWGIAGGPDGNVWFAERIVNKIGRITTAGVVTEFTVPTADQPAGRRGRRPGRQRLVHGGRRQQDRPDHPRWSHHRVHDPHRGQLAHRHRDGPGRQPVVHGASRQPDRADHHGRSGHRVHDPHGEPAGPTGSRPGPDGNLWFVELDGQPDRPDHDHGDDHGVPDPDREQRASGHLRRARRQPLVHGNQRQQDRPDHDLGDGHGEFPIPTVNSQPFGITAGPDGNLWFIEKADKIGRITTAGVITEFVVPQGGQLREIAKGADGNLWFTETNGNRIGRIVP